jgi:hypothetical protein
MRTRAYTSGAGPTAPAHASLTGPMCKVSKHETAGAHASSETSSMVASNTDRHVQPSTEAIEPVLQLPVTVCMSMKPLAHQAACVVSPTTGWQTQLA